MAILFQKLNSTLLVLKKTFNDEKKTEIERKAELYILGDNLQISTWLLYFMFPESKAGMLKNIPMLRDLKLTEEDLHFQVRRNENLKKKLGFWWEG